MCDHCGCRAFDEIAELTAEHERILELAWLVAEHGDGGARQALLALLAVHVAKEEGGLYPQLLAVGALDDEVVEGLEDEHQTIDGALGGAGWDRRAFYELAAHIEQEEMELFPAAMLGFDDEDWAVVADAYRHAAEMAGPEPADRAP